MYLDRAWLGLRFLRAVILYNLPDVLVYIRVINSSQAIRVVQLMCTFICIVSSFNICLDSTLLWDLQGVPYFVRPWLA